MSKRRSSKSASPPAARASATGHAPGALRAATPPQPTLSWDAAGRLLLVVLAAAGVLSVLFALRVPFDANPDEAAHRDYVRLLVEQRGFVRFVAGDPARFETHQPPLYYLLCVPIYLLSGGSVLALRLVAVPLQLLTIWLAFRAARDLFPDRAEIALGTAAFVAFLPTQTQLGGAINNDALTTLVCVALFWRLGRLAAVGQSAKGAALTGVLLGVGLLTKSSVLTLVPALVLAHGIAVRARLLTTRTALAHLGLALGLALLVSAPWLVRNTLLYGDPLALSIYTQTGPNFTPAQVMQASGWTMADYARNVGVRSFATFWYFLSPNLPFSRFAGPPVPLVLVLVLVLLGFLGTIRWLRGESGGEPGQRRAVVLFLAGVLCLVPFFARFVLTVFQAQGRYFLPALLPVALVTCLGWATLFSERRRTLGALGVAGVLLVLALLALARGGFLA